MNSIIPNINHLFVRVMYNGDNIVFPVSSKELVEVNFSNQIRGFIYYDIEDEALRFFGNVWETVPKEDYQIFSIGYFYP